MGIKLNGHQISVSHLLFCQSFPRICLPIHSPAALTPRSSFHVSYRSAAITHSSVSTKAPQQRSDLPSTPKPCTYTIHRSADPSHQSARTDRRSTPMTLINGDVFPKQCRRSRLGDRTQLPEIKSVGSYWEGL